MFPLGNQLGGHAESAMLSPLVSALLQRLVAGSAHGQFSPQAFGPLPASYQAGAGVPGHAVGPAAAAPGPWGGGGGVLAPRGGAQIDADSGLAPPWPGAVVAAYGPNGPIYYGTPEWARYQLEHGSFPRSAALTGHGLSPIAGALLGRLQSPMLGRGPVL